MPMRNPRSSTPPYSRNAIQTREGEKHIPSVYPYTTADGLPDHGMAGVPGNHDNASDGNHSSSHGDFLLHLLRKGNNKDGGSKKSNQSLPFPAEGDPWQITDPAVAELGPSHNFQNPNPNLPNIWPRPMNSVPDQPLPLLVDQLSRPPPNPHFSPYPFQNHYDTKPLQPPPFGPLGGGSQGSGPGPFYGASANGRLGLPPRWVGPTYPYGHIPQAPFPDGADIHKPSLDAWQVQSHRLGNGVDHLRGFSEIKNERFPLGEPKANDIAAKATENCIGGRTALASSVQSNYSARNLNESQNCISRNDVGNRHSVPSGQEQLIRDGILQFGSIAWHSEHEKGNDKGNSFNDTRTHELPSRDILLHNAELPQTLQGQNGVVRFLRRTSSNQQGRGKPTAEVKGALMDGSKTQAAVERRVHKGSSQKGISKGKTAMFRERRDTSGVNRGETRKGPEVQSSLEMERDRNKNNARSNGKVQSDIFRKEGIRNEAIQFEITKNRHTMEPSKELTQCKTDKEGLDNYSFQAGDGDVINKGKGSQQEWRVKPTQADDHMQSDNFDSFSTITGHLSALNVNGPEICDSNDELYKPFSRRPSNGDKTTFSQPLDFHHDEFSSPFVQVFEKEQSHNEVAEGAISEGSRRSAVEKRVGGNHRVDAVRRRVFRENPDNLKIERNRYRDGNRNNLGPPRECKDLESNNRQAMPMSKQCRRQLFTKMRRKEFQYRIDLAMLTPQFLKLYESLIPCKEEETKRKQLISCLEKLVNKQWPEARLHLFGSCANAFGVSKSDIDVCFCIDDESSTKAELVLKLAEILEAEDMQNVQPLTHARVPIVKFTDPLTGISCDICINNILAIVNTKLLHDYAQIDIRLQQLAFMVKHWAKCRQINETYQGTLSSYAYVLMCIHFLQQRKPAILPCLQGMEATYRVTIGEIECSYFDKVDELKDYGAKNKETLGQLLSSFFDYWAFRHDYSNSVISVRIGGFLSKNQKEWTRRIGKERHLICIEDPFEISHDLGRVVDKYSIGVLKDEFQRAAEIMQYDSDPCVTLFEPYVQS